MPPRRPRRELHLAQLLPNLMTIGALCAGLTAIKSGIDGRFGLAVGFIVLAAILDGLDGRIARLLKSESSIGAELDSLCDLVNFGVAPAVVLYLWAFQEEMARAGWIAALIYAVACAMRLARFNIGAREPENDGSAFRGVPSPAGAMLALLPMILSHAVNGGVPMAEPLVALWLVGVAWLMVATFETPSFKKATFYADNVRYVVLGAVALIAALLTYPWATLMVFDLAYLVLILWCLGRHLLGGTPPDPDLPPSGE